MQTTRRRFLQLAGLGAAGAATGLSLLAPEPERRIWQVSAQAPVQSRGPFYETSFAEIKASVAELRELSPALASEQEQIYETARSLASLAERTGTRRGKPFDHYVSEAIDVRVKQRARAAEDFERTRVYRRARAVGTPNSLTYEDYGTAFAVPAGLIWAKNV